MGRIYCDYLFKEKWLCKRSLREIFEREEAKRLLERIKIHDKFL